MSFYRKYPLFAIVITVFAVIALGEVALIYERFAASRAAAKRLEDRKNELLGMSQLTPPPTRDVATTIEADLAKAQRSLESMQSELKGKGSAGDRIRTAKVPAARSDAYFDLLTFVEKTREAARKNDVEVRPEAARFGFAAYANEGPQQEHIEPVFRQRQIAQYLVESLIEARPRAILAVKREPTVTKADREARATAQANGETPPEITVEDGPDYFIIDPRMSARVPGYIDTTAFRFVFTGQTAALRAFLNRLASFELPVLVREVEVDIATGEEAVSPAHNDEPAAEPAREGSPAASVVLSAEAPGAKPQKPVAPKAAPRARPPTATPIVSKSLSKFTVTVEFVELVTPAPAAAETTGAPPAPAS